MASHFTTKQVFSLKEIADQIQGAINGTFKRYIWIHAEIARLNFHGAHAYPNLTEKENGQEVCTIKGVIFQWDFVRINQQFEKVLGCPLASGMKVLLYGVVDFHPIYGLSIKIQDIDPTYTLGDNEREKQETLKRLKEEGIFENNRNLPFPNLPSRLAVLSEITSQGYQDFKSVIGKRTPRYKIHTHLFRVSVQGDKAVHSITQAIREVGARRNEFDAIVLVRGGGDGTAFQCFNNYDLTKAIALSPLPVFTGIGHASNECIADMVAYHREITPTATANYLVNIMEDAANEVETLSQRLAVSAVQGITIGKSQLEQQSNTLQSVVKRELSSEREKLAYSTSRLWNGKDRVLFQARTEVRIAMGQVKTEAASLNQIEQERIIQHHKQIRRAVISCLGSANSTLSASAIRLQQAVKKKVETEQRELEFALQCIRKDCRKVLNDERKQTELLETKMKLLNPAETLKRGYSITMINGKPVMSNEAIEPGDLLETVLASGRIISTTIETKS